MANHKSALKRLRQNKKRRLLNKSRKSRIKTLTKAVETAVAAHSTDEATVLLRKAQKVLAQTAAKGTFHPRTAARKMSRLSKKVAALAKA